MARYVTNLENGAGERQLQTMLEVGCQVGNGSWAESVSGLDLRQGIDQRPIFRMTVQRQIPEFLYGRCRPYVVEMAMGTEQKAKVAASFCDGFAQSFRFVTGIDQDRFPCRLRPDQVGVHLQRAKGQGLQRPVRQTVILPVRRLAGRSAATPAGGER